MTYHSYVASGGRLLYTPSVELVVGWTMRETSLFRSEFFFFHLSIMSCWCEKRYQALPSFSFPYYKQQEAGQGLGTRLVQQALRPYVLVLELTVWFHMWLLKPCMLVHGWKSHIVLAANETQVGWPETFWSKCDHHSKNDQHVLRVSRSLI